jgi:hypothetical protein
VTLKLIGKKYLGDEAAQLRFLDEAHEGESRDDDPSTANRHENRLWDDRIREERFRTSADIFKSLRSFTDKRVIGVKYEPP